MEARLLRRYKRFLADVQLEDGTEMTVHCPNPGAMTGLDHPNARVFISDSLNPKRKLRHTLEIVDTGQALVGINTMRTNFLGREAIEAGMIPSVDRFSSIRPEQKYGENSRIDFLLESEPAQKTYIEVKNVHLVRQAGLHEFPDCVTKRGAKHLNELSKVVNAGHRAIMLFVIQRSDGDRFSLAADIDPGYKQAFDRAVGAGVEAIAVKCEVTPDRIRPIAKVQIVDGAAAGRPKIE